MLMNLLVFSDKKHSSGSRRSSSWITYTPVR